jgi:murein DD-endopeptidase MepM/ murein hydrolase activator NlpD
MLRLDSLGERLAKSAGLQPQELQSLELGSIPGQGGAESSAVPPRNLTVLEFTQMLDRLVREVDGRTDQLNVLEALLLQNSTSRRFLPSLRPILSGWFSSNFGVRIDPFTGQRAFHDGIDFPAPVGTPVFAAASGTVVFAGVQPEYGKMVEIDHGNGLVSRYAHASKLLVKEGDLVVTGQRIANVGTTGRSTGPHLHFEVRLNGVAQNPARFFKRAG